MKMTDLKIPWERYALITELADRLSKTKTQFGKTMLQKLVFLLQESFDLKLGYDFELYTYGPFCTQLLIDLDQVEALNGVEVKPVTSGYGGYEIEPGTQKGLIIKKGVSLLEREGISNDLDELIRHFGGLLAVDLELRATIVFVANDHKRLGQDLSIKEMARIVGEIKSKFSEKVIKDAIIELAENGYIELAD